jgi:hypothetical protein
MERGRLVTASTCKAPKPPLRMAGVLYMAGRAPRFLEEGMVVDVVVVEGKMGWDDSSLAVTMCQLLRQVQDDLRYFPMVRKA